MPVDDLRSGTWVTYIGGRATSARLRRCRVEVISGPDAGLIRDVEASVIRIGARRGNDVQLTDSKVSGLHCEIRLDDRGYRLRDLDSTNGTYVSSLRINDVYISPACQIALGTTRLKFEPLGESVEVELADTDRYGSMIGRSVKMREMFARLEKLARTDTTVLVTGETGAGKELVAEALHDYSPRSKGAFVVLDCGSIPPNLIESELFGHERGAFTGATNSYAGAFERAHGGTVFLDEIGELPLGMQPKLLRVLERKEVRRVGGSKTIEVDLRVVAATNRDLGVEVNRGRFREDLYYRLAVARVHVPPLRERKDDLPLLIEHILSTTPNGETASIAQETIDLMMKHDWPGNIRELRNACERAVLLSTGAMIERHHLTVDDPARRPGSSRRSATIPPPLGGMTPIAPSAADMPSQVRATVAELEKQRILEALDKCAGNQTRAAEMLGISRRTLINRLDEYGIARPRKRDE